ncbi:MAG: Cell division protein FtsL [Pseudomonadota bacterium]|jgi:cell division protein FtsL
MMTKPVRKKVRSERVEGRRTYWALVSLVGLFTVLGLAHAWTRLQVLDRGYAVGRAQLENDRLHRQIKGLELELMTLQRAARVDTEAEQRLDMHRPGPDRRIVLDSRPATAARELPTATATP